jgi:hypothetical protein
MIVMVSAGPIPNPEGRRGLPLAGGFACAGSVIRE